MLGPVLSGAITMLVGAASVWLGLLGIFGTTRRVHLGWLLPLSGVDLEMRPLGGFFMAITGAVAVPVGMYAIGYARREHLSGVALAVPPLFVAAMLLVPAAESVATFLLGWELMALASLLLVATDHDRSEVRSAALVYAVMTQLGFVAILIGLMALSAAAGTERFADMAGVSGPVHTVVFLLTLAGFGSKAGLLPLHAWLPRAHPEAPSPVSALMSAAMVNLGIYGLLLIDVQVLGPGPRWWALTLLAVGVVSALYGVLQATVATDIKRLLAYSTTENMGLIAVAVGAAALFAGSGSDGPATVAMAAAFLHTAAHAAFKSLGFLGAGAVLASTGLRDLDLMGGLARRMPATTSLFGLAALGASGLPLGAGFVGEWLLLQSLIHADAGASVVVALTTPLAVGAVALTTGLGVAAMAKAFGIGVLARPRSGAAELAREASPTMLGGMTVAAAACAVVALSPSLLAPALRRLVAELRVSGSATLDDFGAVIRLPRMSGSIAPGLLAASLLAAVVAAGVLSALRSRRRPKPAALPLWACGSEEPTARMQYTATSFAEPLQRVFDNVLQPDSDVEITHLEESRYMVQSITYRARIADAIEQRLYTPLIGAVAAMARWVRLAHNGSVHLYLAYGALGVLVVLLVAL
ncbi:MAG TPA: proton-conducting transporter membrane subunit [Mycobacterium sp.]|nr:proton-conducting transporter membrane subunit [Mycobacterium sp.]